MLNTGMTFVTPSPLPVMSQGKITEWLWVTCLIVVEFDFSSTNGYHPKDLLIVMDSERESRESMLLAHHDDDDDANLY